MPSDEEYDPFAEDSSANADYAHKRPADTLERGKVYKLVNFFTQKSVFDEPKGSGNFPSNLVVQFYDAGLKFQTIMPKKYNNKSKKYIDSMNALIAKKMNPQLVYYGKVGMGNEVDILRHTQEVDMKKLEMITKLMLSESPQKKMADVNNQESSPMKRKAQTSFEEEPLFETPGKKGKN